MTTERTTAEKKFFAGLVESIAPGWRMRLMDEGALAGLDSGIYLLDTRTLWCGMTLLRSAELASVRARGQASGLEAAAFSAHASHLMVEAQAALAAGRTPDRDIERDMYFAAAAGLVCSCTADVVLQCMGGGATDGLRGGLRGSLRGHWVFVRYDIPGDPGPSRPLFARADGPLRLLSPEEVREFAATAMAMDLGKADSAMRKTIGQRRPALNPYFARVAPPEWIDRTAPEG